MMGVNEAELIGRFMLVFLVEEVLYGHHVLTLGFQECSMLVIIDKGAYKILQGKLRRKAVP